MWEEYWNDRCKRRSKQSVRIEAPSSLIKSCKDFYKKTESYNKQAPPTHWSKMEMWNGSSNTHRKGASTSLDCGPDNSFSSFTRDFCSHVRHRLSCKLHERTPHEIAVGEKPDLSRMHIFGERCFVLLSNAEKADKLDTRSKPGLLLVTSLVQRTRTRSGTKTKWSFRKKSDLLV